MNILNSIQITENNSFKGVYGRKKYLCLVENIIVYGKKFFKATFG